MGRAIIFVTLLCCAALCAGEALDPPILKKVKAATVFLKVKRNNESQGSGFFVGADLICTNSHVLGMNREVSSPPELITVIVHSGTPDKELRLLGNLVAFDPEADLAFVRVAAPAGAGKALPPPLELATGKEVVETTPVFIFGFPFGDALASSNANPAITIGPGSVSSLRNDDDGFLAAIQINGNINPGNSGGPITDRAGKLVAVSVATIVGTQIGFAIPCDRVQRNLSGRIKTVSYVNLRKEKDNERYSFDVDVELVDPLSKVTEVSYHYWMATPGKKRPVDPVTKLALHGAEGDSLRSKVVLKQDATDKHWKGAVKLRVSPQTQLWSCCSVKRGATPELFIGAADQSAALGCAVPAEGAPLAEKTDSSRPAIVSQPLGQAPVPEVPKDLELLRGTTERDEKGREFTRVVSKATKIKLGKSKLLQMVTAPNGSAVYAVFQGDSTIKIFNPLNLQETGEIPVARSPISLWCDDKRIVAACEESKVFVVVDVAGKKVLKSIPIRDDPALLPVRVVGRAPDGAYMTIWKVKDGAWWDMLLYHVDDAGKARKILKGAIDWCMYTSSNSRLWIQHNFGGSPSGVPEWFEVASGKKVDLMQNKLLGETAAFHRNFGHCFVTFDRRNLVLPTESRDDKSAYGTKTVVTDLNLTRIVMELPGAVIAECPKDGLFIAWGLMSAGSGRPRPEITYISRSSGRVVRRISLEGFDPHPAVFSHVSAIPGTVYIPGCESFLWTDSHGDRGEVTLIRCGPVAGKAVGADPVVNGANEPPAEVLVGKEVQFTPQFTKPDNARKVVFKLKRGVEGMSIDPETGKLSFKPTDATLGKYDIEISADVDGTEVRVLAWMIEIKF